MNHYHIHDNFIIIIIIIIAIIIIIIIVIIIIMVISIIIIANIITKLNADKEVFSRKRFEYIISRGCNVYLDNSLRPNDTYMRQ